MNLSISTIDKARIITITGVVDNNEANRLSDTLMGCVTEGCKIILVDVSSMASICNHGLRALVTAAKMLSATHGELRLCGAHSNLSTSICSLGLGQIIKCDHDLNAGLLAADYVARASQSVHQSTSNTFAALSAINAQRRAS